MKLSDAQLTEAFHLAFLQLLQARINQGHYVLKGGANLRYFFESVRYSEDIDLDAISIEAWKLEERVDNILGSAAIQVLLRPTGLALRGPGKSKQTETTQRWKPEIDVGDRQEPMRTRIEFSHRRTDRRRVLEAVPDRLVAPYALRPPTMLHYTGPAAIDQKIQALALRSETQARDVFDLELLLRLRAGESGPDTPREVLGDAVERALELPFEAFEDQVLPFLDSEVVELYNDPGTWEQMKNFVATRISELQ